MTDGSVEKVAPRNARHVAPPKRSYTPEGCTGLVTVERFARHMKGHGEEWGTRVFAEGPVGSAGALAPYERAHVWTTIVWGTEAFDPEAINTMRQKGAYCPVPPSAERLAEAEAKAVFEFRAWEFERTMPLREVKALSTACPYCGAVAPVGTRWVNGRAECVNKDGYDHEAPHGRYLGHQPGRGEVDEFAEYGVTGLDGAEVGEAVVVVEVVPDHPTPKEFWNTRVRLGAVAERPAAVGSYVARHFDDTPRRLVIREVAVEPYVYDSVHAARLAFARRALRADDEATSA